MAAACVALLPARRRRRRGHRGRRVLRGRARAARARGGRAVDRGVDLCDGRVPRRRLRRHVRRPRWRHDEGTGAGNHEGFARRRIRCDRHREHVGDEAVRAGDAPAARGRGRAVRRASALAPCRHGADLEAGLRAWRREGEAARAADDERGIRDRGADLPAPRSLYTGHRCDDTGRHAGRDHRSGTRRAVAGPLFVRRLGGYTGDCLGAVQQLAEALIYIAVLATLGHGAWNA